MTVRFRRAFIHAAQRLKANFGANKQVFRNRLRLKNDQRSSNRTSLVVKKELTAAA
jgi:hypothetical protein